MRFAERSISESICGHVGFVDYAGGEAVVV